MPNARIFEWASQGVPRHPSSSSLRWQKSKTFTYGFLGVGISLRFSKIHCTHDKSILVVPINSWQPHEHHGTTLHGQLSLQSKPLKTKPKP